MVESTDAESPGPAVKPEPESSRQRRLDLSGINAPQMGFVGGAAFAGSGAVAFGLTATSTISRAITLVAIPLLAAGGIVMMIVGHISAWQTRAHQMTLANISTMSLIAWAGLSILALHVDPIPFLSTITAALISLGIAWGIPLLRNDAGKRSKGAVDDDAQPSAAPSRPHGAEDGGREGDATPNEEE